MSRFTLRGKKPGTTVSYGLDHAIGWWADLSNRKGEEVAEVHTHGPFAKPGGKMMVIEKVQEWASEEDLPAHQKYFDAMVMDLDPATVR